MAMELELGMLISKLNPYENTDMYLVPGNPVQVKGAVQLLRDGPKKDDPDVKKLMET